MSHTPHELHEEFPQYDTLIHHLRETDSHFQRLANEYHEVNRKVHRAETDIEPVDDATMIDMRKERMRLKDEIFEMLARHEPSPQPVPED